MVTTDKINDQILKANSFVCVGLDPIEELMPDEFLGSGASTVEKIYKFLTCVVDNTAMHAAGFKIQKAFFDQYASGHYLLKSLINYCKKNYPGKIIVTDCKIGDVAHTLKAYSQNLFDHLNSDGIVVNPYMGNEIFDFAKKTLNKLFFFLVRTSNAGNGLFQDVVSKDGKKLWELVLEKVCETWDKTGNCVPILSFEHQEEIKFLRHKMPERMPIFWAGYGKQQRDITTLSYLTDKSGAGVIVNSSRGILYAEYENHQRWEDAISSNVIRMKEELNSKKSLVCKAVIS